ncbi:hypothetical protein [Roseicyclus sp.]|uniref:hypothetical protein n=1 Tax=Roseicyclus sp. TaxID=1914329 RepID=UPI003F6C2829
MTKDAQSLCDFNRRIREAATAGDLEDMVVLGEKRRQFLDALPQSASGRGADLISALEEAASDNKGFVSAIESAMQQARARGKITLQARRRYHKTQTTL